MIKNVFICVFVPQLHFKLEHMYVRTFPGIKAKVSGTSVSLGIVVFHLCVLVLRTFAAHSSRNGSSV